TPVTRPTPRLTMPRLLFLTLLLISPLLAEEPAPTGEFLFTINCSACHLPDQQIVGPSLVEIRGLYEKNIDGFLAWAKNPVQKRKGAIEMPSMAHLPDEQLKLIHAHILEISKGLKQAKQSTGDPFSLSATIAQRPNLLRIFMPDAGPAAIAVAVDHTYSYCWDAGTCRLRYLWRDGFIDGYPVWKANGNDLPNVVGTKILTEPDSPLAQLSGGAPPKFLGYKLKDGLPTFRYRLGKTTVTERLTAADGTLQRHFTLDPPPAKDLLLPLANEKGVTWTYHKGTPGKGALEGSLTLSPAEAAAFTLTLVQP
ncbi:MAG: cytochrome c, partial [Verrucomicrobia bacterium]|nr:cytochrome c [Verrucomicrobiota bacterium]